MFLNTPHAAEFWRSSARRTASRAAETRFITGAFQAGFVMPFTASGMMGFTNCPGGVNPFLFAASAE